MTKKYPTYKPSDIDWFSDLPKHWRLLRIKALTEYVINGVWGEEPQNDEFDIICVRVADFNMKTLGVDKGLLTIRNIKENQKRYRTLVHGDILIEKSGGGEHQPVGRCITYDGAEPAVSSNFVGKIEIRKESTSSRFLTYMLYSTYTARINERSINQTTGIQNLDTASYFNEVVPVPPLEEQNTIASFLDRKTAQIDETIRKKERLIEFLQEERAILISRLITRGLDDTATFNPSGVDFLGDIPEKWELKKLKYIVSKIGSGITPKGGAEVYKTSGIPLLRSQNIYFDGLHLDDVAYITQDMHDDMANTKVKDGDVLLNITGASIGRCYYVEEWLGEANVNQHVCIVRPGKAVETEYLYIFFLSSLGQIQIDRLQSGANREGLNFEQLKNFFIPVPPLNEQEKIISTFKSTSLRVDNTVRKIHQEILLLREYRTALINEAVTGKVCVV